MQNLNIPKTKQGMEWLARLAERAEKYTTFSEEDKIRILNSYASYLLSKKFSRSFNKLAKGFANFAGILGLEHLEIVKKVAEGLEKQKSELGKKKYPKKINKKPANN